MMGEEACQRFNGRESPSFCLLAEDLTGLIVVAFKYCFALRHALDDGPEESKHMELLWWHLRKREDSWVRWK